MSAEGCEDIRIAHQMPLLPLQERQSTMPTLMVYQSLMAAHGGTFRALQQAMMNSIEEV